MVQKGIHPVALRSRSDGEKMTKDIALVNDHLLLSMGLVAQQGGQECYNFTHLLLAHSS